MQDQFPLPSCFFSGADGDLGSAIAATKSGQSAVISVYRTKIAGHCRLITVTWYRNLLANGLSVSVEGSADASERSGGKDGSSCKVELRPWYFWRRQGSKRFYVEARPVDVFWDLKGAKFSGDPEPHSDYYVAVVADDEVVLLLGDLQKEATRRTGSRASAIEATLVSKKEHVFGKRRFVTRAKLHEKDKFREISIECSSGADGGGSSGSRLGHSVDPDMVIRIDGRGLINVKHLQWKFRGNQTILVDGVKVEVFWDVHDWLFGPGLRHGLFIFKPAAVAPSPAPAAEEAVSLSSLFSRDGTGGGGGNGGGGGGGGGGGLSGFCLFLYAWKVE